jgi:hypothetical protein
MANFLQFKEGENINNDFSQKKSKFIKFKTDNFSR